MSASPGRTALLAGIVVLSLAACGTGYRNVREYPVADGPCRALAVVACEEGDVLGWVDAAENLRLVRAETDVLAQIQSVAIAPDGARAAIVSVGEGHPVVTVYRVADLVTGGGRAGERLPAEKTVDPYPLAIEDVRWIESDTIEFCSAIDFIRFDRESRRGGYDESRSEPPMRTWRWRLRDDAFTPAP
ncbi:MAG TPA: LpqB family beta-propeller domain-containing protein [Acidobacteriota bacterium]|nr:LpqB family beta-propeller domain-containing protein [Acidobacteriota bacterium]